MNATVLYAYAMISIRIPLLSPCNFIVYPIGIIKPEVTASVACEPPLMCTSAVPSDISIVIASTHKRVWGTLRSTLRPRQG